MTSNQIILGCKSGDQRSYRALVDTYSSMLMGICVRYMNNQMEAKDALQETYIRIFKSISNIDETGNFEGWMRRIAVNECLKLINKRITFQDLDQEQSSFDNIKPVQIDHNLEAQDLLKVIDQLPEHYKVIFNLYEIEGYSHKEISTMVGIGESSCRTKLMRSKTIIKSILEKKSVEI